MYLVLVTSHVLAAIVGFGTVVVIPVVRATASPPDALRIEHRLASRVLTPALTWSLISGITQVLTGPYRFGLIWVDTSITLLVVAFAVAGAGISRPARRVLDARGDVAAAGRRLRTSWIALATIGLAVVTLMVTKPA